MRKKRVMINISEEDLLVLNAVKSRLSLSACIVDLAMKQAQFELKRASGSFSKPNFQAHAQKPAERGEESQEMPWA